MMPQAPTGIYWKFYFIFAASFFFSSALFDLEVRYISTFVIVRNKENCIILAR